MSTLQTAKWHHWCLFHLHISHKAAKSMAKPLASCMLNYSRLSTCQGETKSFEDHPSTRGCLTSLSKSSLGHFQHQYLPDHKLLVNVYIYRLTVKSVSYCCVHGSWLFSNPATNISAVVSEVLATANENRSQITVTLWTVIGYLLCNVFWNLFIMRFPFNTWCCKNFGNCSTKI